MVSCTSCQVPLGPAIALKVIQFWSGNTGCCGGSRAGVPCDDITEPCAEVCVKAGGLELKVDRAREGWVSGQLLNKVFWSRLSKKNTGCSLAEVVGCMVMTVPSDGGWEVGVSGGWSAG